jgi:hypothetical protein
MPKQKNILDLAAQTMRNRASEISEASAPTGSMIDVGVGGLINAATLALKMGAMGGAGIPQRAIFPLESSLSKLTESAKAGDTPLTQTGKAVAGFAEGYVLDKVLHYIPDKVKNVIKQYALNTAALTVIPEVKNAIDRVADGEDPLKIDWKSMVKGIGVTALLPAIFGAGGETPSMSKEEISRTNENTWRIKQADIQRRSIEKNREIAKLQDQYLKEQQAQRAVQESQPTKLVASETIPTQQSAVPIETKWVNTGKEGQDYYEVIDPNSPLAGTTMNTSRLRELGFKVPEVLKEPSPTTPQSPQSTISTAHNQTTGTKIIEPKQVVNIHAQKVIEKTAGELGDIMGEAATHLKMNLNEQGRMAKEAWDSNPKLADESMLDPTKLPHIIGADGHPMKAEALWVEGKNRAIESEIGRASCRERV